MDGSGLSAVIPFFLKSRDSCRYPTYTVMAARADDSVKCFRNGATCKLMGRQLSWCTSKYIGLPHSAMDVHSVFRSVSIQHRKRPATNKIHKDAFYVTHTSIKTWFLIHLNYLDLIFFFVISLILIYFSVLVAVNGWKIYFSIQTKIKNKIIFWFSILYYISRSSD